jgi:hypothetical protein
MNKTEYNRFVVEKNHTKQYLADRLSDGTITLFLGAGISFVFGLPSWSDMANRLLCEAEKLPEKPTTDQIYDALRNATEGWDKDTIKSEVKKAIYKDVSLDDLTIFKSNLLIAMLSLFLSRGKRGSIKRVVTYNYDSMLEWFLSRFGLDVRCIPNLPALEGNEDVRIYHPHGFLPHPIMSEYWPESPEILLNKNDAYSRTASKNLWKSKCEDLINSGIALFIGLSPNTIKDYAVAPLLNECAKIRDCDLPLGFWFLLKEEMTKTVEQDLRDKAIVPMVVDDYKEIYESLLKICQIALSKRK